MYFRKHFITSAAALSSLATLTPVSAFQQSLYTHGTTNTFGSNKHEQLHPPIRPSFFVGKIQPMQMNPRCRHRYNNQTRLYGTEKSFFEKVGDKVKSILPFGKKEALTKKEQAKQDVSSSIDTVLKDAPLGVRMMGKLIKPLVSNMAGSIAQAMEEQSRQMSDVLGDARRLIVQDSRATDYLGEPIEVGSPFSQSSSTVSVNGKTRSSVQASFEVRGRRGSGVATMTATDGQIDQLSLNVNGRNISIDTILSSSSWSSTSVSKDDDVTSRGLGRNRRKDDDIIDAEFVDKKITR